MCVEQLDSICVLIIIIIVLKAKFHQWNKAHRISVCTWLTSVGLHVEVTVGVGGRGGCRGGRGATARPRALERAALGEGRGVAVARSRATKAAVGISLSGLLLHVGVAGA